MKPRFPKQLLILGKKYTVKYVGGKPLGSDELGVCDPDKHTLSIRSKLVPEQTLSTLLHECLHAISDAVEINLSEKQVKKLETGVYDLLVNNPDFVDCIRRK